MKNLLAIAVIIALTSCATIVSDSDYSVNIQSTPDSAEFEIFNSDGLKVSSGTTPNTVLLDASADVHYPKIDMRPEEALYNALINNDVSMILFLLDRGQPTPTSATRFCMRSSRLPVKRWSIS